MSTRQASQQKAHSDDEENCDMVHAIQLMQKLAVHCNELDEALRDAAALWLSEGEDKAVLESYHRPFGSRLYHWVMGGDVSFWGSGRADISTKEEAMDDEDSDDEGDHGSQSSGEGEEKEPTSEEDAKQRMYQEHVKRMKRDRRTHDELWLSGVAVVVFASFVISAIGKSKK